MSEGFNAAHNPFWGLVDPGRIGIAGHSLGASAVSYVGQIDDRVDAIVAWDNLRASQADPPACASGSAPRPSSPPITKPAIGISNDYGITPTPMTSDPDPEAKNAAFLEYKDAGVDSMEFNDPRRLALGVGVHPGDDHRDRWASRRFAEATWSTWYTTAWFDKHVKCAAGSACEAEADARLLTDRWRNDERSGQIDLNDDANAFSFYFTLPLRLPDRRRHRGHLRRHARRLPVDGPGRPTPGYSFVADAHTAPDGGGGGGGGQRCALPQRGSSAADTPTTLPPSDAGDAIRGRAGNDRLRGAAGDDCLYGQRGRDLLAGGSGDDRLLGGHGRDRIRCGGGRDVAVAGRRDRVARSCERVKR